MPPGTPNAAPAELPVSPSWQGNLTAWLLAHRVYPEAARRRGEQGTVSLRFTVTRDGTVHGIILVRSSGARTLDDAALDMLRGAHLPSFPHTMAQPSVTVTVPIRYVLEH
jgi:protein TonB